ncbi:hypothetical protein Q3G72_008510 [Acer saccharum]|nr:hypothetical protein Q3G72_008510 [Acer saccharum]
MFSIQCLLVTSMIFSVSVTATKFNPAKRPIRGTIVHQPIAVQRYVINFKYWGGANANAPIFAYLGAEAPLDEDVGEVPCRSRKETMKNASTLGYFNSAQALADYAEVLLYIKKKYHAEQSPVIVLGGSYGGSNDRSLSKKKHQRVPKSISMVFLLGLIESQLIMEAKVLKNISDTVTSVTTVNGSHCLDILPAILSDPEWLTRQPEIEVDIIEKWIVLC